MKAEDKPMINNKKKTTSENPAPPKDQQKKQEPAKNNKKKSGFQSMLKQIGLALLFLAIGALAVVLVIYLPAANKLKTAQSELDRLIPVETQYLELQTSYDKAQTQAMVYKLMSDTNRLEKAVADNNSERITQYLIYVEDDLSELVISELPELPSSLTAQFEKIKSSINNKSATAVNDLQEFYNDLLLVADNL